MVEYLSVKDQKRLARTCVACKIGDHDRCTRVREPTRKMKWIPCQCNHVIPKTVNPVDTGAVRSLNSWGDKC